MKKLKYLLCILTLGILIFLSLPVEFTFAASWFKYKDYSSGKTVKYYDVVPSYIIDGKKADLSKQPSLISSRNIAYASANALFRDSIGMSVKFSLKNQCIRFTYRGHVLKMFIGETRALFDGVEIEAPCAPFRIKYKKNGIKATMVPSRFVTETFGLSYEWDEDTSSVNIEIPLFISIDKVEKIYEGTKGKIYFEGEYFDQKGTYSLIFSSNAMINADCGILEKAGIKYKYKKKSGMITLSYNGNEVKYCINSRVSYVNGIFARNPYQPMLISYPDLDKEFVYIPGRFTFENLGFYYNWNDDIDCSEIYYEDPSNKKDKDGDSNKEKDGDKNVTEADKNPKLVKIINTVKGYKFFIDKDNCSQELEISLPMVKSIEDIDIRDNVYECMNELVIKGDHSEYFKDLSIENTGEAVLQIRIYYDSDADETYIRLFSNMILGCSPKMEEEGVLKIRFDYIKNLYKKVIVLDAGHGGHDPGAISVGDKYNESDLNLKIINNCRELFKKTDVKVFYTRTDDTFITLDDRAELSELVGADMFISVHHNASDNAKADGTSVHCSAMNEYESLNGLTSEKLAWRMLNSLLDYLETDMFAEGVIKRNFVVIRDSKAPAVLLEIGFVTNKKELKRLASDSFSKKVAQCIVDNVLDIYGEAYGEDATDNNDETNINDTVNEEESSNDKEDKEKEEIIQPLG